MQDRYLPDDFPSYVVKNGTYYALYEFGKWDDWC